MLRWLAANLRTFLLAFILALAVWVSAVTAADPDETRPYPAEVPLEFVGQDPGLVIVGERPAGVTVTLRAPRSVWEELTARPESVRAVADLTGLAAGTHTVEVQVQVAARPARLISVAPASFELTLEPLATRSLPVALILAGEPAAGYRAGEATLEPATAVVSGPASVVGQVARLVVLLDLSGARQDVNASLPLTAADASGAPLEGVSIHPERVQVFVPVAQMGGYRDLAVKVVTYGRPASGYTLTSVVATPAVVTVFSSDSALIASLPGYVETAAIDLSGVSADIEARQALILPPGVSVVGETTVLVQIGISPIQGSLKLTNQAITAVNLGAGLQARIAPLYVDVILSGPLPLLNSLSPSSLRVLVDLTGLGPGTHHVTPRIELPAGIAVESVLPATVEVVIAPASTPTP